MSDLPALTTAVLEAHNDEVWNIEWSHDGASLASASKDRSAIIWRRAPTVHSTSSTQDWIAHVILREHPYPVGRLAWSLDDSVLITSSEHTMNMWNAETGDCIRTLNDRHTETITAVSWLPDGAGFVTGALDRSIIFWNLDGEIRDIWRPLTVGICDLAVAPDGTCLVAVGVEQKPETTSTTSEPGFEQSQNPTPTSDETAVLIRPSPYFKNWEVLIFDLAAQEMEASLPLNHGEVSCVRISRDSQFALLNHAPNEIFLLDLRTAQIVMKYLGQQQSRHIIRSSFGGVNGSLVMSGSEDGKVYIWHRESGRLLHVLAGHGNGSVNSVAQNPKNEHMFASCSDDRTTRIWEISPIV